MFWKTEMVESGSLNEALDKEEVTLEEILDDAYVIQEAKNDNAKLLNFLQQHLGALMEHALSEPSGAPEERSRFKYAHVSAELLTVPSQDFAKALFSCSEVRTKLAAFLQPESLNPLTASFYCKVMTQLLARQPPSEGEVVEFVKGIPGLVKDLLRHLGTSAVMDVLFRLVSVPEEEEDALAIKAYLVEEGLVTGLVGAFHPAQGAQEARNAALVWNELVRVLRDLQYNRDEKSYDPLLEALQGPEALAALAGRMFSPEGRASEGVLEAGAQVFINLLQTIYIQGNPLELAAKAEAQVSETGNWATGEADSSKPPRQRQTSGSSRTEPKEEIWTPDPHHLVEAAAAAALPALAEVMAEPRSSQAPLPMGATATLGRGRLELCKLLLALLNTNHSQAQTGTAETGILQTLMRLVEQHPYHSLFHQSLAQLCVCALFAQPGPGGPQAESEPQPPSATDSDAKPPPAQPHQSLLLALLGPARLLQAILHVCGTWEDKTQEAQPQRQLVPFFFRLAKAVQSARLKGPNGKLLEETMASAPDDLLTRWEAFVRGPLALYVEANASDDGAEAALPTPSTSFSITDVEDDALVRDAINAAIKSGTLPSSAQFVKDADISSDLPLGTPTDLDIEAPPEMEASSESSEEEVGMPCEDPSEVFEAMASARGPQLPGLNHPFSSAPAAEGAAGDTGGWADFESVPMEEAVSGGDWPGATASAGGGGASGFADFSVFGASSEASAGLAAATAAGGGGWDPFAPAKPAETSPSPPPPPPRANIPAPPNHPPPKPPANA